jgi:hypothetical protein
MASSKVRTIVRVGVVSVIVAAILWLALMLPHFFPASGSSGPTTAPNTPPPPSVAPSGPTNAKVVPSAQILGDRVSVGVTVCPAGTVPLNRSWSCALTISNTQPGEVDWDPITHIGTTGALHLVSIAGPSLPVRIASGQSATFTLVFSGPTQGGSVNVPIVIDMV